jgi:hypothetical protein
MNMKRGLVFTLCALALAASTAQAANVNLSLNLRYTDPADPSEGGRWFLMAKTDSTIGLAGVSAYIANIDTTGIVLGNNVASLQYPTMANNVTGSIANSGNPYNGVFEDGAIDPVNVVWGQDVSVGGAILANVGRPGGPGNYATDPLGNATWANSALLASGTFAGGGNAGNFFNRPIFVDDVGTQLNDTGANTLASTTLGDEALLATVTKTVRGDSLASFGLNSPGTAGLRPGDANRDGAVGAPDSALMFGNWGPLATNRGWDTGDFNDDGATGAPDSALLFGAWNPLGTLYVPPTVGAVPEPSTFLLAGMAALVACRAGRRR